MDFGVVGLDHHGLGIPSSSSSNVMSSSSSPDPENKQRALYGSGLSCSSNGDILKQERSSGSGLEEYWRSSKLAKTNANGSTPLRSNSASNGGASAATTLSFFDGESYNNQHIMNHQMLSFATSSSKSDAHNSATLPCFANAYAARNTGFNSSPMMMMRSGSGSGPSFTAAQWMELEHQALIYKHITANVPIPANLLLPIRRAFDASPFPHSALFRSNPLHGVGAWGSFQLGFSNNADPEPGRCRRTDGKKWRCSRDAVADQKYCERHMNRGRHRSRKPVEGQAGANNNAASAAPNLAPLPGAAAAASAMTGNAHQPVRSFDINGASNRMFMKDGPNAANGSLSLLSSMDNSTLQFPRKQQVPYDMPSSARSSDFKGLVSSDQQQGSLHQFIDDWPNKTRPASPWTDRTQLSISIPTTETNLSLSREQSHDADSSGRPASWIPVSWEASLGGPLGEVLHQGNGHSFATSEHCKSASSTTTSSVLNLMPEGWDSSPPVGSSPTGVLQKAVFGSLSNSSAGSSPRAQLNQSEGIDLLGDNHRMA